PQVGSAITLTGQIVISGSVQIIGPGPGKLSVSGNGVGRVFYLTATNPFTATVSGLTLRDGFAFKSGGGAILDADADLTVDNVALLDNVAGAVGGGVAVLAFAHPLTNSLTIRNSVISGNHAGAGGGVYLY